MSKIQVNEIVNHFDTGAPDCPKGLTVTGFSTFTGGSSFSGSVSIGGTLTYEDVTNIDSVGLSTFQNGIHVTGGNLGIGTDNPITKLNVHSGTTDLAAQIVSDDAEVFLAFKDGNSTGNQQVQIGGVGNTCVVYAGGNERVRIGDLGNTGIGVANPEDFHVKARNLVLANGGDDVGITLDCNTNKEGSIYFADGSTGDNLRRGQIVYNHDGDILRFVTNAVERMRIDGSQGRVGINTTGFADTAVALNIKNGASGSEHTFLDIECNNNESCRVRFSENGSTYPGEIRYLHSNNSMSLFTNSTEQIRIESTGKFFLENMTGNAVGGSTVKYNNSDKELRYDTSSRLLKTNITECTYGIETIKKLKPSRYNPQEYDKEGNITVIDQFCIGFIADEMVEDVPEVVHMYPKSSLTKNVEDTELVPAAISYDKLTPVLTKALQEAITKIETLETKVAALEGN